MLTLLRHVAATFCSIKWSRHDASRKKKALPVVCRMSVSTRESPSDMFLFLALLSRFGEQLPAPSHTCVTSSIRATMQMLPLRSTGVTYTTVDRNPL
jgi:hypothetical protein